MNIQERTELLAKELFGWKWMRYIGIPTRGTPGYSKKMPVRQFMSPETVAEWRKDSRFADMVEADGTEPLSYCYCSSQGSGWPDFTDLDVRDVPIFLPSESFGCGVLVALPCRRLSRQLAKDAGKWSSNTGNVGTQSCTNTPD